MLKNLSKNLTETIENINYDYFLRDPQRIQILTEDGVINIPPRLENRHALLLGVSGAGKTQMIMQILDSLRRRGDKAIVLDIKGGLTEIFYNPDTDFILNPLDKRCMKWSIKNELNLSLKDAEAEVIATSLINDAGAKTDSEKFFANSAKNVAKGLILYAFANDNYSNAGIANSLFTSDFNLIKKRLQAVNAVDALSALGDKPTPQSEGVKGTMHVWSKAIDLLRNIDGDFCLTDWLKSDAKESSFIFLNYPLKYEKILSPVARFFTDFFLNIMLEAGENLNRRVFLVLDEFQNLEAIPTITRVLTLGRSAGVSLELGTQDFGLIDKNYGTEAKETMINNVSTLFINKISEPNTAKYTSQLLGDVEVEEYQTSSSLSLDESWDRINVQTQKKTEPLVIPQELQTLPDLNFYVKIDNMFAKSKLKHIDRPKRNIAFDPITQNVDLIDEVDETEPEETAEKQEQTPAEAEAETETSEIII